MKPPSLPPKLPTIRDFDWVNCRTDWRYRLTPKLWTSTHDFWLAILALIGSALLAVGVFFPVTTGPIFVKTWVFFDTCPVNGVILLILAAGSVFFTVRRRYWRLPFTGVAALGITALSFFLVRADLARAKQRAADLPDANDLGSQFFRVLWRNSMADVRMDWPVWIVLWLGASFLILSGIRHLLPADKAP